MDHYQTLADIILETLGKDSFIFLKEHNTLLFSPEQPPLFLNREEVKDALRQGAFLPKFMWFDGNGKEPNHLQNLGKIILHPKYRDYQSLWATNLNFSIDNTVKMVKHWITEPDTILNILKHTQTDYFDINQVLAIPMPPDYHYIYQLETIVQTVSDKFLHSDEHIYALKDYLVDRVENIQDSDYIAQLARTLAKIYPDNLEKFSDLACVTKHLNAYDNMFSSHRHSFSFNMDLNQVYNYYMLPEYNIKEYQAVLGLISENIKSQGEKLGVLDISIGHQEKIITNTVPTYLSSYILVQTHEPSQFYQQHFENIFINVMNQLKAQALPLSVEEYNSDKNEQLHNINQLIEQYVPKYLLSLYLENTLPSNNFNTSNTSNTKKMKI